MHSLTGGIHAEVTRSIIPALRPRGTKGYQLPEFYSGATERSGRFTEGLLLRRLHARLVDVLHPGQADSQRVELLVAS